MFAGTGTALITPFAKDGSVDEEALRRLVDFQESNGVDSCRAGAPASPPPSTTRSTSA